MKLNRGTRMAIGEAFQIMSDEQLTWNQIYQTVAEGTPRVVWLFGCKVIKKY